ncbi:O-acetyl-ADP-ribose deacetylase [Abditibacteriota bacterium]|nr:O-acetyl-ADP-ribose deacetylase [Abditibacteriota bacterium]
MKIHQTELQVVRASALDVEAEAIVNAANTGMRGGGGIDGAIHYRAGRDLMEELQQVAPYGAQTAEVVVTSGHALPHQYIFHVAGPIWNARHEAECEELLASSYEHVLAEADGRQLTTIVLPSISTGVYAFPLDRAAPIALETAISFLQSHPETSLRSVTFAMWGGEEHHIFRRALEKLNQ